MRVSVSFSKWSTGSVELQVDMHSRCIYSRSLEVFLDFIECNRCFTLRVYLHCISSSSALDQWLWMALSEKKRETEMEGIEGLEDDPENLLAKSFVELMITIYRAQDVKRREMAIGVLEDFLEKSKACTTIDEFDAVLQEHSLNWAQWNFFVNPNKETIGDPRGKWPLALHSDLVKVSAQFELRPSFRDGRIFTNFLGVRKDDDLDPGEERLDVNQLIEVAAFVIRKRCKEISEADSTVWPMNDYMAVRFMFSLPFDSFKITRRFIFSLSSLSIMKCKFSFSSTIIPLENC